MFEIKNLDKIVFYTSLRFIRLACSSYPVESIENPQLTAVNTFVCRNGRKAI